MKIYTLIWSGKKKERVTVNFLILKFGMSSYDKRLFKGRNFIEDSELIKPSNLDDLDRDCFLFQDSNYKPEYLEMPIKIEGDLRQKSTKRE